MSYTSTLSAIGSRLEHLHHADDVPATDWALGELAAALGARDQVAAVEEHGVRLGVHADRAGAAAANGGLRVRALSRRVARLGALFVAPEPHGALDELAALEAVVIVDVVEREHVLQLARTQARHRRLVLHILEQHSLVAWHRAPLARRAAALMNTAASTSASANASR